MATWCFGKSLSEMEFEELVDEMMRIVALAEDFDVDVDAIARILDTIDEKFPLDIIQRSAEESWAEFYECYVDITGNP